MKYGPEDFRAASEWALLAVKAMSAEQVPHSLRKIRASSNRRLTPVQTRTLYRELNRNEQLRQNTLEVLEASAGKSGPLSTDHDPRLTASRLFLSRPDGWERDAGRLITEARLGDTSEEARSLRRQLDEARSEVDKLKRQAKESRRAYSARFRRKTRQLRNDLERSKKRGRDLESELSKQRQDNRDLDRELEAAFDELDLADARVRELRRLVGKERAAHSSPPSTGHDGRREGLNRNPLETARMLDQMVSFWEVGHSVDSCPVTSSPRLEVPAGIDPKSGEAVRWVYDHAPRLTLVVDGWNAAHHWHYHQNNPENPDQRTIEFLTNRLDRLARYSVGKHRVSFYLDSEHAKGWNAECDNRFKAGSLTGRYVVDADDAIVAEAAQRADQPVVVITNDQELTDRCRAHGAVVLDSRALAEWMANSSV